MGDARSRQAIGVMAAIVVLGAVLAACLGLPGTTASDQPKVAFESRPLGAQVSLAPSGASCTAPCSVPAPDKSGTYNVTFTLPGYGSQTLPVKVIVAKENW